MSDEGIGIGYFYVFWGFGEQGVPTFGTRVEGRRAFFGHVGRRGRW